ncbi:MAG: hypothetical protein FWG61_07870 [Firmicutes bacterium]|nr:hypothetical protein [Bacillota bacterium]
MMDKRYRIGNAQSIGCREVQNNYFSSSYNEVGDLLTVLADGNIDHPNGRNAAVLAVEYCADIFTQKYSIPLNEYAGQFLLDTALAANKRVQEAIYIGRSPRLSLTMVLLRGKELNYFNVGANRVFVYNGHNERILGNDAYNLYSSGRCILSTKNVIALLSNGAYMYMHPLERIKIITSRQKINDKAQAMIDSINEKGLDKQMNATALLIECRV